MKRAGGGLYGEADRIAQARRPGFLAAAVMAKALDGRARWIFLGDVAARADCDEEMLTVGGEEQRSRPMTAAIAQCARRGHGLAFTVGRRRTQPVGIAPYRVGVGDIEVIAPDRHAVRPRQSGDEGLDQIGPGRRRHCRAAT